ncbi:MAG: DUF4272 domain-containing protein [Clostridium butyricum]|nr:DUF4272 domain-containing protein [Clostridium butyricum]
MGILDKLKKKKEKEEKYSGRYFILSSENYFDKIINSLCNTFGISSDGEGNTINLNNNDIHIKIGVFCDSNNDDEKELIKDQVGRVYGHFYEVETEKTDIKTNLLYKLDLTHGLIIVNYVFDNENVEEKKAMIEYPLIGVLKEIDGIILFSGEEDGLYCPSYNDDKALELILSDGGKSGLQSYLPYEEFTMTVDKNDITEEQINRRLKSRKFVAEKSIYVPAWYPVIESKEKSKCRSAKEIAERAVSFMIVALYSECLLGENMSVEDAYDFVKEFIERFDAEKFLSPKEKEYINNTESTEQERISYSWQYENLWVMEWALGFTDELDFPDHICDVPLTVRLLKNYESIEDIVQHSKPKSEEELLDECDLIFCLDWACVDTRIHRLPAPAGMDGGVVLERHKCLNWLVGYEGSEWDDITADT